MLPTLSLVPLSPSPYLCGGFTISPHCVLQKLAKMFYYQISDHTLLGSKGHSEGREREMGGGGGGGGGG